MPETLTISELGKIVDIPVKTIRFYEEIQLITTAKRAENGYRMYDQSAIEELKLIKYARDLGLPIKQIRKLMKGCDNNCAHTKQYIESEISDYLRLLDERISQLKILKKKLGALKNQLRTEPNCATDTYCCNVLYQLSNLEKGGEKL